RFRWVVDTAHKGFRRILRLMGPATLGLAALQVNLIINSAIASHLQEGAISWLNYAFRMVYLPIGVIGVAVATVSSVELSRHAAREDMESFKESISAALRIVAYFSIPASAGLVLLAKPIIALIFDYGRFADSPVATSNTAVALSLYASTLFFYCGIKVVAPAFYALDKARLPMIASMTAVSVNLIWSLSTYQTLGFKALALGAALAALVNFAVLATSLNRQLGGLRGHGLRLALVKIVALTVPMALAAWSLNLMLEHLWGSASFTARCAGIVLPILVAAVVWLWGGRLLNLREAQDVWAALKQRWKQ
ncbi:MAG: lipid II flippase MurJ, partial [Planctomycetota bacterium]